MHICMKKRLKSNKEGPLAAYPLVYKVIQKHFINLIRKFWQKTCLIDLLPISAKLENIFISVASKPINIRWITTGSRPL